MRRQDLRRFDTHLMISILGTFCLASLIFLIFWTTNFIVVKITDLRFYLWISYAVFFLIALIVYLATQQPTIVWTKHSDIKTKKGKYVFDSGQSYVIKSKTKSMLRKVYRDAINQGKNGLYITRTNPKIIKRRLISENTVLLWLTEVNTHNAINPTDVEELSYTIKKFLRKSKDTIISLEGVEYLINVVPFNKILHLFQDIRDEVALQGGNLLLRLDPNVLKKKQLSLIEKEFVEWKHGS